jgi:diguanylate cyclase (GGDEF)-like protein/PAS domain S-box-containing protein
MRLLDAFASSESIVALLNAQDGRFRDINGAFERTTGYKRDQVIGRIPFEVGVWTDPEFRAQLWETLRTERRVVDMPTPVTCADGRVLAGRLHVEYMRQDDEPMVFCLLQILPDEAVETIAERRDSLYRTLYLSASEGIYRSLPGGGFIDANPALARILGYESPEQFLLTTGTDARQIYADRDEANRVFSALETTDRVDQVRIQARRRDGRVIWLSENTRVVRDAEGVATFYEGTIEDITAQVEAEQALKQSQELYRVLLDNSRDGVFLVQRGKVRFANEAMHTMLGYPQPELIGMDYLLLIDPSDMAPQIKRKQAREDGSRELQMFEVRMRRKDGRSILCEVRADAVDYQGDIASTGTLRDVTVERAHQQALEQAERRYRELFQDSPAGLFRTSMDGQILEVNPVLAIMLGYDSVEHLRESVHTMREVYAEPDQRQQMVDRAVRDGSFNEVETQIITRSGELKWVSASVRLIRDENGEPLHFAGSALDIDRQHRMQQALLRSENKYRILVEHSQVGVFISYKARYLYVNRYFADMLGYSEEQLLQMELPQLVAPDYLQLAREIIQKRLAGSLEAEEFEICALHQNGSRVYVTVSVAPVEVDGEIHMIGTVRNVSKQREAEARLHFHAAHDSLTGLSNRLVFNRRLAEVIARSASGEEGGYCVIFLDLDGFKWVNDSLGHGAGDRLLLEIARRLENELVHEVMIARYGGDEFTILPDGPCDQTRAIKIANRILSLFEQPFEIGGQQVFSAASLGIVLSRPDYESPDQVLRDADTAMYRAKAAGKSGFVVFDEAMHAEARTRLQMETDFRLAFEREQFVLHYQPIVSLKTGALVGAEALVRWQHPVRGLIAPEEFLPVAEETGLITDMDAWVLQEACRQIAAWRGSHPSAAALTMNVNVDERQMASPEMLEDVVRILGKHDLPAHCLRLEVTETVFRSGRGHIEGQLGSLKTLGIGLAVDDFGTGYSSLESFAASPFDALKIDQIFVRDLESNPRHRAIVRTIISFATDLGLLLTAEGIENEGQRRLLLELGCQYGQGYLFAKPLSPEQFELRL